MHHCSKLVFRCLPDETNKQIFIVYQTRQISIILWYDVLKMAKSVFWGNDSSLLSASSEVYSELYL